jgi:hypothetical protein
MQAFDWFIRNVNKTTKNITHPATFLAASVDNRRRIPFDDALAVGSRTVERNNMMEIAEH